jgi:pyruvate formate lyase activating enzyme
LSDSTTGIVFDIRKFSIHDGPGIRTTVFFKGCPLRCSWCHNPESQSSKPEQVYWEERCIKCQACIAACPQNAIHWDGNRIITDAGKCVLSGACVESCYAEARQIAGHAMTVAQVMSEIKADLAFFDQSGGGVTFSGGEPLMQSDYMLALLLACRESEIRTVLDTCGFASWATLNRLRPYIDVFLYDLKLMDPVRHKQHTGVSNIRILENLQKLSRYGHDIVLRVPIIPGANDDEQNLRAIGAFAASLPRLNRVDLLPYHRTAIGKYERLHKAYGFSEVQPPSEARMAEIQQIFEECGLHVGVGG